MNINGRRWGRACPSRWWRRGPLSDGSGSPGPDGLIIGVDRFGASAPAQRIAEELGLTAPAIAVRLRIWLGARSP